MHLCINESVRLGVIDRVTDKREGAVEDAVDEIHDARVASEVFGHKYRRSVTVCVREGREFAAHLREYLGSRRAEAVDALLYIAHHEAVVRAGNRLENSVLQSVHVLVLVDVYEGELSRHIFCNVGGLAVPDKTAVAQPLHIRVGKRRAAALLLEERGVEVAEEFVKSGEPRIKPCKEVAPHILGVEEILGVFLRVLLHHTA